MKAKKSIRPIDLTFLDADEPATFAQTMLRFADEMNRVVKEINEALEELNETK